MSITGSSPSILPGNSPVSYQVMVRYPMLSPESDVEPIATLAHGTAYHHDDQPMIEYFEAPNFYSTQNFMFANDDENNILGGFYFQGARSWAIENDLSSVMTTVFRNPAIDPCGFCGLGDQGVNTDPDVHTVEYAFRLPSNLEGATSGQPITESLDYQSPVYSTTPESTGSSLPSNQSLASVQLPAILTTFKPKWNEDNKVVLRIYQPTNQVLSTKLGVVGKCIKNDTLTPITALENIDQTSSRVIVNSFQNGVYQLDLHYALSTVELQYDC